MSQTPIKPAEVQSGAAQVSQGTATQPLPRPASILKPNPPPAPKLVSETPPPPAAGVAPAAAPVRTPLVPPGAAAAAALVRPTAALAMIRGRHRLTAMSFVFCVLLPVALTAFYLWGKAVDQYASTVGFSVRREEVSSAMDLLGGISGLSKSSSSDTDILYQFLKSQKLVADLDAKLDLRKIWSKPQGDPIYALDPDGSIEDLVDYWTQMVRTSYDSASGLIEVRVLAFTPEDATLIADNLFSQSSIMINSLSTVARDDAVSYSREELLETESRLKDARGAVTMFRTKHQIVDPSSDMASHSGVLGALQAQLTTAQVELDLLAPSTQEGDPRLTQAKRRIEVIEAHMATERNKVGVGPDGQVDDAYASIVGEYENLAVNLEFAQRAYTAALASHDAAQAEARRKSRYLAAHILPTTAEVSRYPARFTTLATISVFVFLAWAISVLVIYSLKDRR